MTFDDLRDEWRNEADRPMGPPEIRKVLEVVQGRYETVERTVHGRDVREILAALFVIAVFGAMWPIWRVSRVAIVGALIIMAGMGLIVLMLLSARKPAPLSFDTSVLEFSRRRLAWLDGQVRLLRSVAWWYVAPTFVGCLLIFWGLTHGDLLAFGPLALFDVAVAAFIIGLNRYAVRKSLLPVREDVARLVDALTTPPSE